MLLIPNTAVTVDSDSAVRLFTVHGLLDEVTVRNKPTIQTHTVYVHSATVVRVVYISKLHAVHFNFISGFEEGNCDKNNKLNIELRNNNSIILSLLLRFIVLFSLNYLKFSRF